GLERLMDNLRKFTDRQLANLLALMKQLEAKGHDAPHIAAAARKEADRRAWGRPD
ncbi:unnamed protein product, partial [marine sediment metagenome]